MKDRGGDGFLCLSSERRAHREDMTFVFIEA